VVRGIKRYVLFEAEEPLSEAGWETVKKFLGQRFASAKPIPLKGDLSRLIVRTDNLGAAGMRDAFETFVVSGVRVRSVLTSGNIGKLKRRAARSESDG